MTAPAGGARRDERPGPRVDTSQAVCLRRVTRLFDGLPAIAHVDLDVPAGEVVWLAGPNGSGKSTLLRVLATALSPTFGGGTVLGHDLVRERDRVRARTELLGHQARAYADLTAEENLALTCTLYGLDRRGIAPALARTGLDTVATVRVGAFSQGMRQRLGLARVLLRNPDLLLLDEPYAGLDVQARAIVDDVLAAARAGGRTVLLASHEPPDVGLVDRVVELEGGRLVGPPRPRLDDVPAPAAAAAPAPQPAPAAQPAPSAQAPATVSAVLR